MTTNELPLEKRIAAEIDVDLSNPPVPTPEMLESRDNVEILGYPPRTGLLLGGFDPDEISVDFLVELHDLAEDHDLSLDSTSVGQA